MQKVNNPKKDFTLTPMTVLQFNKTRFQCRLCQSNIEFDIGNDNTFLSKVEHERFFGMQLTSFRVEHRTTECRHINTVLVDHQGYFRGYVDAFTEPLEKKDIHKVFFTIDSITGLITHPVFRTLLFFDSNEGWYVDIVCNEAIKTADLLGLLLEKIFEAKKIYTIIPKKLCITLADLNFHIWIHETKYLCANFMKEDDWKAFNNIALKIVNHSFSMKALPIKKAFNIFMRVMETAKIAAEDTDATIYIQLLTNNLLFSQVKIREEFKTRIPRILDRLDSEFPQIKLLNAEIINGISSPIDVIGRNPTKLREILLMIDFVNNRNLLG